MSLTERRKGAAGEREVLRLVRQEGWPGAYRSSNGLAQKQRGDIADGPAGVSIEVKRTETASVWKWWEQAAADAGAATPVVAFRRSSSPWLALIELDELLPLLKLRES